jgi:putative outer membrane protein
LLKEENRRCKGRSDQDRRTLAELKKILEIEGLLDTYSHLFEDDDTIGRGFPVNNYSGLNSLRARLKNRRWDGRSLLEGDGSDGNVPADTLTGTRGDGYGLGKSGKTTGSLSDTIPTPAEYIALVCSGNECIGSPVYFFFNLNTAHLTDTSQMLNLDELARVAKKHNLSVKITGAADSSTGTAVINDSLSVSRAEFIATELERRGIPSGRLLKAGRGGIDDYLPTEANRHTKVELFFSRTIQTVE